MDKKPGKEKPTTPGAFGRAIKGDDRERNNGQGKEGTREGKG